MLHLPKTKEILQVLGLHSRDVSGLMGFMVWELTDESGQIKECGWSKNLITQVGDQYYGERAAGISSPPGQVTCMKLGTGTTAVAKTGAGAALVTYQGGSDVAIAGGWPTSALSGSSRRIQWETVWNAGVATASGLAEVVIVNDALADATSTAANTISRALLSPTANKGALDTLTVVWNHDLLGA